MSTPDSKPGMLRKWFGRTPVEPAKDAAIGSAVGDSQWMTGEKAELKVMIERKRRNDFVRKRELDMLRRIRREGLTAEQAAALLDPLQLEEAESRPSAPGAAQIDSVKAKIDAIERQMVGQTAGAPMRPPAVALGGVEPRRRLPLAPALPLARGPLGDDTTLPAALLPTEIQDTRPMDFAAPSPPMAPAAAAGKSPAAAAPWSPPSHLAPVEVSEVVQDRELDDAVIAFANADFGHCERVLVDLVSETGVRRNSDDTWLVLFDFYRATGALAKFEALGAEFAQRFQKSAPQWFSLPRLVAQATRSNVARSQSAGSASWVCPEGLDRNALAQLRAYTLKAPLPWVLDWTLLQRVEADAAAELTALLQHWAGQTIEMRWLAGDRLFSVLHEAAPTAVRDADPNYWLARMEALRLVNRPDQFDEAAIDYCVTYEVSPPSWQRARATVRMAGPGLFTGSAQMSIAGDAATSFLESALDPSSPQPAQVTTVELSGQLGGDLTELLKGLSAGVEAAQVVRISCALLIRIDFIAAGDLLNWAIAQRTAQRDITFFDTHRLVALMFGAMGINEQARVVLRQG